MIRHELVTLAQTTQQFAAKMFYKLASKAEDGWTGWDDAECRAFIEAKLQARVVRLLEGDTSQAIDVANLAMFLWHQSEGG